MIEPSSDLGGRPSRPARVAFFMHGFEMGGAQKMTLVLTEALARRGLDVDLVVATDKGPLRDSVSKSVRILVLDSKRAFDRLSRRARTRAVVPALARYIRQEAPDVLIGAANHASISAALGHLLARRPDTRLFLRATNPLARAQGSLLKRIAARLLFTRARQIIAVSQPVADDHRAILGREMPIVVVPEPVVDTEFLRRAEAPPFHPWITAGHPLIVAIGRLAEQKDYPTLLKAFQTLRTTDPEARLLIIGDGPLRDELLALRQSLGLDGFVDFAGMIENPLPALRHARCLALSSRWEGLGIVVIEALALGCPVVATDTSAVRWVLQDGVFGHLSPVGDPALLAQNLSKALRQAPAASSLRQRSNDFSEAAIAANYIKLIGVPQ